MTDYPVEQRQIDELLKGMRGRVLVGGLGLGYAAHRLKRMRAVWQVVVVEKSYEVLNLCGMHAQAGTAGPKVELVHADLFDYLRNYKGSAFDFAFYDIWQSDGEHTFFKVVCPLLQLSKDKVKHPPRCWNEDVMRGQLHLGLQQRLITATFELTPPEGDLTELARAMVRPKHLPPLWEELKPGVLEHYDPIWHNWSVPFFQWWKETQPDEETLQVAIRHYAAGYGKAGFESY
jgi:SAM-dependent methyltransferase